MSVTTGTHRPVTPSDLAARLAESLRADLEDEKDKPPKAYRLLNVSLEERIGADRLIYQMYLSGGEQPPEDVPGLLATDRGEYQGIIRRQSSGMIFMEVAWPLAPAHYLESALFRIDCRAWIGSLIDRLEKEAGRLSPLAVELFNPLAALDIAGGSGDDHRLTYVWTPPGAEQADTLARMIADRLTAGDRVLAAAPSNQVLDEMQSALSAMGEDWSREAVRWGWTDSWSEKKWIGSGQPAEREAPDPAAGLTEKLTSIETALEACRKNISHWVRIHHLKREFVVQETVFRQKHVEWRTKKTAVDRVEREWLRCQAELKTARKAWFNRAARVQNAGRACQEVSVRLGEAEADVGLCRQEKDLVEQRLAEMAAELAGLEDICRDLPSTAELGRELRSLESEKEQLQDEIQTMAQTRSSEPKPAAQARLVLTTLNEGHRTNQLSAAGFDTVVITQAEKIPTAQIFLAAGHAGKRVILGGDFLHFSFETPLTESSCHRTRTEAVQAVFGYRDLLELVGAKKKQVRVIMDGRSVLPQPMADLALDLAYRPAGLSFTGGKVASDPYTGPQPGAMAFHPIALTDTTELNGWCGKTFSSLCPFNLASAIAAVETARSALQNQPAETDEPPRVLLVSPFAAQVDLLAALIEDLGLTGRAAAGTPSALDPADLVILDTVLDQPIIMDRFVDPENAMAPKTELAQAAALARRRFLMLGSSAWLEKRVKPGSALDALTVHIRKHGSALPLDQILLKGDQGGQDPGLAADIGQALSSASKSIFGFLPFFDAAGWPVFETAVRSALERGVAVTLLDSLPNGTAEARETDQMVRSLRRAGAILIPTSGYQGRELIIDRRFIYWRSTDHGLRFQLNAPRTAEAYLSLVQADDIRAKSIDTIGAARSCPECGWPLASSFQATRQGTSDPQPFKIKCLNKNCKYARPLDERLPYQAPPICPVDGRTQYERVRRGRGEIWQCPAHPKTCPVEKVVPGDTP